HLHVTAHGHVQFVDLALSFFVLELPHPLLSHYVDFGCASGRRPFLEIDHCPPHKDHHENSQRNDRPGQFQCGGTFNLFRVHSLAAAVFGGKHKNHGEDGHAHERGQGDQKDIE